MAEYYTVGEAARMLGVRREIVRIHINQGKIKAEHTWGKEGGHYRIPKENIDAIVAQRKGIEMPEKKQPAENKQAAEKTPSVEKTPAATPDTETPKVKTTAKTVIKNRARKAPQKETHEEKSQETKKSAPAPAASKPAAKPGGEQTPQPKRRFGEDYNGLF